MWLSVLLNVAELHHGGDVVVHRRGVLPQFLHCSSVVLVPLLLLSTNRCVKNGFLDYGAFGANRAHILHQN